MNAQALVPESKRTSHRLLNVHPPIKTNDEVCIDVGIKAIHFALQVFFDKQICLPRNKVRCVTERLETSRTRVTVCGHLTAYRNRPTNKDCGDVRSFGSSIVLVNTEGTGHDGLWLPCPSSINSLVPNATGGTQFQVKFIHRKCLCGESNEDGLSVAIYDHPVCTSGHWLVADTTLGRIEVPDLKSLYGTD